MNNRTFTQDLLGVQNDLLRFAIILFTKIRIAISGYIPLFHLSEALKANQSHPKTANC